MWTRWDVRPRGFGRVITGLTDTWSVSTNDVKKCYPTQLFRAPPAASPNGRFISEQNHFSELREQNVRPPSKREVGGGTLAPRSRAAALLPPGSQPPPD